MISTEFLRDLQQVNWDDVLQETDVETAYKLCFSKFNTTLNRYAPLRKRRVKQKETPWMNSEILNKIRERDRMKMQAKKSGSEDQWNMYKNLEIE